MHDFAGLLTAYSVLVRESRADTDLTDDQRGEVVLLLSNVAEAAPRTRGRAIEVVDEFSGDVSLIAYQRVLDIIANV